MTKLMAGLFALVLAGPALAAGGGAVQASSANVGDVASVQRGAKLYMNYCASCHSLGFLRYSRMAEDLGLDQEQVEKNLIFTTAKFGETIQASMSAKDAEQWFGKAPPDLSLIARSRGADWVYTYLKSFYVDESRPIGWNNTLLPGASMPNVLWELQGLQRLAAAPGDVHGGAAGEGNTDANSDAHDVAAQSRFTLSQPGLLQPREFDGAVRDIAAFLVYAGEPAVMKRTAYGVWVVLFLAFFTFLAWLVKREYWKDLH